MLRLLYDIGFFIFSLLYIPSFIFKGKHRKGFGERFGSIPSKSREILGTKSVVWIHGVSVGEIVLAVRLAEVMRLSQPDLTVVLTTTTPAGRDVAEKLKSESDFIFYLPIDFRYCIRRFIHAIRPTKVIILETEIWPNLVWEASSKKIPIWILNGRISDRAFRRYKSFRFFMKPVLRRLEGIGAQDVSMRERFIRLGADGRKVRVVGNLKFDWQPKPSADPAVCAALQKMVPSELLWLVAGSTHQGEEELLFAVYRTLRAKHPKLRLAVAPRHLNRIPDIERQAAEHKISLKKVSTFAANSYDDSRKNEAIVLVDCMGALASFYEAATVAFVGGSLVPVGGHNPIEPAYFEKPVVFGPHMQNFAEMERIFLESKAAIQVQDRVELEKALEELLGSPERRAALGVAAKALVSMHRGAVEKNLELLEARIGP